MPNQNQNIGSLKLSHLPLRPSTLSLLTRRGFISTADVQVSKSAQGGGVSNFASELDISLIEAVGIGREVDSALRSVLNIENNDRQSKRGVYSGNSNDVVQSASSSVAKSMMKHGRPSQTAADILRRNKQSILASRPIISFVRSIDSLLGGGFHPKEVTEVSGLPGVGKTQLAMQLCVDAHLPKEFGGVSGHSIYIDSEGSFSPERTFDMAKALVDHVHFPSRRSKTTVPSNFTPESILDSIHVFRVYDETCQTATILSLPQFLNEMKSKGQPVKLIVIDSIAFHYRCTSNDYKSRTKSLTSTASFLSDLANTFDLAIVVINQMTTKIGAMTNNNNSSSDSRFVPALGESWAHSTTTRILLTFDNYSTNHIDDNDNDRHQRRVCKLVKSPHRAAGSARFSVTEFGVRDT
mmetsp:Transcript_14318/g.17394  ORF Transcript_14318/g.17394 Transcript_14318/m.17394 type:complete len:409 (-) Transcript_14318:155-1381(-)